VLRNCFWAIFSGFFYFSWFSKKKAKSAKNSKNYPKKNWGAASNAAHNQEGAYLPPLGPPRKHPTHMKHRALLEGSSDVVVKSDAPTHTCKEYNTYPTFHAWESLWKNILIEKYIFPLSTMDWIRLKNKHISTTSM
jgi:hypothetical protein